MKKLILLSFVTLNLFIFSSCGGDKSKDADQASTSSGPAIDQSWLSSATGKKWVAEKGDAPFSQMTFFANGKMKDAVSEDDYRIDGDQLVVKVIGLDIKYPMKKTADDRFELTVNGKNVFGYKLDMSAANNGANTTSTDPAPSSTTTTSASSGDTYAVGDKVQIKWNGSWFPGKIKEVKDGGKYKIGYDGYDATWDETVGTDRLKK